MFLNHLNINEDSITFVSRASFYNYSDRTLTVKKSEEPDKQKLFLLSQFCINEFFENLPKTFTISTKNSTLHFNLQMLQETSPVISKFIQDNPDEKNYLINITDDDNILSKIEKLYQGKSITFKESEISIIQRFSQILQIKDFPNYLKPKSLQTNEIDSEGNKIYTSVYNRDNHLLIPSVQIYKKGLSHFLNRDDFKLFKIVTKHKEYQCCIFGVSVSNVIRQMLEKDSTIDEFQYDYEDNDSEFQLICDFFNCKEVVMTNDNVDSLKQIAEDLQINCILHSIDNFINSYEKVSQKIDEQEQIIDKIDELFDLLYNIKNYGVEKVKVSIAQSKWANKEKYVEELASFILQVIKPSFSLQKEISELIIQLDKESNDQNKLNILIPFIVERLLSLYWPTNYQDCSDQYQIRNNVGQTKTRTLEKINLTNRCVYSFIRILYKRGVIPKEEIESRLKDYDLSNNLINAFFLPELIKINPKNISVTENILRMNKRYVYKTSGGFIYMSFNNLMFKDSLLMSFCYYWPKFAMKYLPDKIDLYEKMLDEMEPDDELTKSLRHDDVDKLQKIVTKDEISTVPYNFFDDFEEDLSLINYAALYGSLKCFKYLILNNNEIDESTFYFAICGGNNEIIKIVDQKNPTEIGNSENDLYKCKYLDLKKDNFPLAFWYNFNENNNFRSNYLNSDNDSTSIDKHYFENIQYQRYTKDDDLHIFLNCSNINNIIAPTIAKNQNNLFDWVLENKFIDKSGNSNYKYIALLAALSGNAHALIALIDNGFFITKQIISSAAQNGFLRLTQLLLDLYDNNKERSSADSEDSFDYSAIVHFGSLSIFKLFVKYMDKSNLQQALLHAIDINSTIIIQYIFDNLDKFDFTINDEDFISSALKRSIKRKLVFNFLLDIFKKINPDLFKADLSKLSFFTNLLNQACLDSSLPATEIITDIILKEKPNYDFTKAFLNACNSKSTNICQYFLDKKVFIDFNDSSNISGLGTIDVEIFEKIINNVDPSLRFLYFECIGSAIRNKNMKLIEFILKENPPCEQELIDAVTTNDIDVVDLILKYNSKPLFINQKGKDGTSLCIATNNRNIAIINRLLSIPGIDPNLYDEHNKAPLIIAICDGNIEIVDIFLNYYEKVGIQNNMTIILAAIECIQENCSCGNRDVNKNDWDIIVRFIKTPGIDINYFNYDVYNMPSQSFLFIATYDNKIDIVELLLNFEDINVNICDPASFSTPLMIAVEKNYLKIIELLIKHPQTNINMRNTDDESALTIAVRNNRSNIIDLLINDERFDPIESRLNCAFIYSNNEISNQLYRLKCLDVNQSYTIPFNDNKKTNALLYSVALNDIDKIDMIINHPSFNIYKSRVEKAIFIAAKNNNLDLFQKLVSLIDGNINIFNNENESLFIYAARSLSGDIVDEIINNEHFKNDQILNAFVESYSNTINAVNEQPRQNRFRNFLGGRRNRFIRNNITPIWDTNPVVLHQELLSEKISIIEMMEKLLNYDNEHDHLIKFDKLLPSGKSFFTSFSTNFNDIGLVCDFLIQHGVDPNQCDETGLYPLQYAIIINSIDLVTSLVNTEKIVYTQLKHGFTYLHLAAQNKDSAILSFLLGKNIIDINSENDIGETPFIEASKYKRIDNINVLFQKENVDYLHCNKNGKDALDFFVSLPQDEKNSLKEDREKFYNALVSIINEILDTKK